MRPVNIQMRDCPVCGYPLDVHDFNICPSCGTEFGIDTVGHTYDELRRVWVDNGAPWSSAADPRPRNWNPWMQLINASFEYALPFHFELRLQSDVVRGGIEKREKREMIVQLT